MRRQSISSLAILLIATSVTVEIGHAQTPQSVVATSKAPDPLKKFRSLLEEHWHRIFPNGNRNAGGPQFFKYTFEKLAKNHLEFEMYNRFFCGVSGSIVHPDRADRLDVVKVKDADGHCVVGQYYRCCWPCSCDVMKYARAERVELKLPLDPNQESRVYWVLTIQDPCQGCNVLPCPGFPPEVGAFECARDRTENGLRVKDGSLTKDGSGRLIFALLHQGRYLTEKDQSFDPELLSTCRERIHAQPDELNKMGGMGDIFVDLARRGGETMSHSNADLCKIRPSGTQP